ncbi:hypothetical protein [Amycolatopsis sp. CA-126428]|uniref:hypothetical protein n=1 Tax=Amycolatopsis sp. CA-126428 TaxID=2073158 RepID=UPI000CD12EF2|nr:hypothetical protein [Amycolatopsis sp. CA-126428]
MQAAAGNVATRRFVQARVQRIAEFHEMPPSPTLNIAETGMRSRYVGMTYPVFNGQRSFYRNALPTNATTQIRNALNPPILEPASSGRWRVTDPGRNLGSALVTYPRPGPWTGIFDAAWLRQALASFTVSAPVLGPLVGRLPTSGQVTVSMVDAAGFRQATLTHEQQHVADIRRAFADIFAGRWDSVLTDLSDDPNASFASRGALETEIAQRSGVRDEPGADLMTKLANSLVLRIGLDGMVRDQVLSEPMSFTSARYDPGIRTITLGVAN